LRATCPISFPQIFELCTPAYHTASQSDEGTAIDPMTPSEFDEVWSLLDRDYLAAVACRGPEPVFATICVFRNNLNSRSETT